MYTGIDEAWKAYKETLQTSEYMNRLNIKQRELDFKEGLPYDHEENLWNWFRRNYPEYYDVYKPERLISPEKN